MVRVTVNIIIKLFIFSLLTFSVSSAAAYAEQHIKAYTGTAHFVWVGSLQEAPDYIESWESSENPDLSHQNLKVSYPKEINPDDIVVTSLGEGKKHGLRLSRFTSFSFNSEEINYIGLHHHNAGKEQKELTVIFTLDDGSIEKHQFESAKQGNIGFTGFVTDETTKIAHVDIVTPSGSALSIDNLQWGSFDPVVEAVASGCDMQPELVQWQCDNNQWLVDLKISGNKRAGAWWCSNDADEQCASYDKAISYGYYSKQDDKEIKLVFTDQDDSQCTKAVTITLPTGCDNSCSYHKDNAGKLVETCDKDGRLVITTKPLVKPILSVAQIHTVVATDNSTDQYIPMELSEAFFRKDLPRLKHKPSRPATLIPLH